MPDLENFIDQCLIGLVDRGQDVMMILVPGSGGIPRVISNLEFDDQDRLLKHITKDNSLVERKSVLIRGESE